MPSTASRHHATVERLAGWIVAGRYGQDGALPNEAELSEVLSVSRTVLREAIKTLSAKGLVRAKPRTGTRVQPPDAWHLLDPEVIRWRFAGGIGPDLVDDIVEFRLAIEPHAAKLCARRCLDVAAMRAALRRMDRAIEGEGSYVDADLAFHAEILDGAGNVFLRQMTPFIAGVLRLSFEVSVNAGSARAAFPLHTAVLAGIERRDEPAAETAMTAIIQEARRDLFGAIEPPTGGRRTLEPSHRPQL